MGVDMISAVWKLNAQGVKLTAAKLNVLLALADRANNETGKAWPGKNEISIRTGMARRNVQKHIRALEKRGLLTKTPCFGPNGRQTSNMYCLMLPGFPWVDSEERKDRGVSKATPLNPNPTSRGVESDTPQSPARGVESDTPEGCRNQLGRGVETDSGGASKPTPPYIEPSVEPSEEPRESVGDKGDTQDAREADGSTHPPFEFWITEAERITKKPLPPRTSAQREVIDATAADCAEKYGATQAKRILGTIAKGRPAALSSPQELLRYALLGWGVPTQVAETARRNEAAHIKAAGRRRAADCELCGHTGKMPCVAFRVLRPHPESDTWRYLGAGEDMTPRDGERRENTYGPCVCQTESPTEAQVKVAAWNREMHETHGDHAGLARYLSDLPDVLGGT